MRTAAYGRTRGGGAVGVVVAGARRRRYRQDFTWSRRDFSVQWVTESPTVGPRGCQSATRRQPTAKPCSTSIPTPIAVTLPSVIHDTLYVFPTFSISRSYSSGNSPLSKK